MGLFSEIAFKRFSAGDPIGIDYDQERMNRAEAALSVKHKSWPYGHMLGTIRVGDWVFVETPFGRGLYALNIFSGGVAKRPALLCVSPRSAMASAIFSATAEGSMTLIFSFFSISTA